MKKTGLVLEGGGMRGIYTAGVLDVLLENNIMTDGVIGVSAGAIHGCSYVSEQKGRSINYNVKYSRDPRYMSFRSLIKTGDFFGAEFCYYELPERLVPFDNDAFDKAPCEFYVVCTDVQTGKPVYHRCDTLRGSEIEWVRASASLPILARIVDIEGRQLLDGGISDSIPAKAFREMGYDKLLVIRTRPEEYRKKPMSMRSLSRRVFRKYPKLFEAMAQRHVMYNRELEEIAEMQKNGDALVICPSRSVKIGRIERDPDVIRRMYNLGRADAENMLGRIKEFFAAE